MGCTPKQLAKSMYLAIEFAEKQSQLVSEARQVRMTVLVKHGPQEST